ncbi:MAG: glycosyltransferase family 2 protein [Rhizobiaceae bacterium]
MKQSPKIFVITPTYQTNPNWLRQCIDSVQAQSVPNVQQIIINDGDNQFERPAGFNGILLNCAVNANDYGDTPRAIGTEKAVSLGATAVAYLDADNWFEPHHLESVLKLHGKTGACIIATKRTFRTLEGDFLANCPDCGTSSFADTSAMVFFPEAYSLLKHWGAMADWMHPIADRVLWNKVVESGLKYAFTNQRTINYRCRDQIFYTRYGREIPTDAISSDEVEKALEKWRRHRSTDLAFENNYSGRGYTERFTPSC